MNNIILIIILKQKTNTKIFGKEVVEINKKKTLIEIPDDEYKYSFFSFSIKNMDLILVLTLHKILLPYFCSSNNVRFILRFRIE